MLQAVRHKLKGQHATTPLRVSPLLLREFRDDQEVDDEEEDRERRHGVTLLRSLA